MSDQGSDYSTSGETCVWKDPGGVPDCPYPAWVEDPEGWCLYHSPENGKTKEMAQKVWAEARRKEKEPDPNFVGWHFPEDPDRRGFNCSIFQRGAVFADATFQGEAWFQNATFQEGAWFGGATFQGEAWFQGATFYHRDAWFEGATFQGDAWFEDTTFQEVARFGGATFQGLAWFRGATFGGETGFRAATFQRSASFLRATFRNTASFDGAVFQGDATFSFGDIPWLGDFASPARFKGDASFGSVTFQEDARFARVIFERVADFGRATFQRCAEFENVTFEADAVFDGAEFRWAGFFSGAKFKAGFRVGFDTPSPWSWLWGRRPFRRAEQGETAYRLAKEAARARGDYRRAGEYHYAEQCAIEYGNRKKWGWKPLSRGFWRSFFEWPFARLLFGYGEKPLRPLIVGLVVILLWSFFYCYFGGIGPGDPMLLTHDPTWPECLHFSVVTFTTLGYGDFQPKPDCRPIADAEAVLGAALMALFIVGLTRKYMR